VHDTPKKPEDAGQARHGAQLRNPWICCHAREPTKNKQQTVQQLLPQGDLYAHPQAVAKPADHADAGQGH
jgi:hypothetical protein